ncbi:FadR/GntR family transcriptional regulator [Leifsonia sp. A12D58]|uniref:FadR/GntR family transcriptional regulator n=1 Tax=Leifsonia sp. A12D58 TaxID=3397674 RepID=UPI0039E022DE
MSDERRAWQMVLEHIEADLLSGALRPGDHLPSERALSIELGVGRSSVREAIRVLEVLGLIRTATGSGPTSGAIIVATPSGGMSALMRLQVAATGFAVSDIVKTRLVLETSVAADLAATEPRPDLTLATDLLDAMEPGEADATQLTINEFLALDTQFHLTLAEILGNQVIAATMAGLRSSVESYARVGASHLDSWADASARLMHEHRQIIAAIEAGDADRARTVVHAHISGYYAESHLTGQQLDQ